MLGYILVCLLFFSKREPKLPRALGNGGYLLSHKCSTIGDAELNDPVRNGKGWDLSAITTLMFSLLDKNASLKEQRPLAVRAERIKTFFFRLLSK